MARANHSTLSAEVLRVDPERVATFNGLQSTFSNTLKLIANVYSTANSPSELAFVYAV